MEQNRLDITPEAPRPPRVSLRQAFWQYGTAVFAVAIGWMLRVTLAGQLGSSVPYITFFPSVMFAAWFGGLGPGLLATLLSLAAVFSIFSPERPFPQTSAETAGAALFVMVGVFISAINHALRRSRAASDLRLQALVEETSRRSRVEDTLAQARREAEQARDLFEITLAGIGDGVIATNPQGQVTFLNSVARDLTGWSQSEAEGKPIAKVFPIRHQKTGLPVESPVDRALRDGVIVGLANHTVLVSREGREIPIEDSAAPMRDKDQRILGAVLVFRDVTARRKSEGALARSEERLRLALEAGRIGVWDWDVQKNHIEWSDRVSEFHGVERDRVPFSMEDFAQLIHPEDRDGVSQAIGASLSRDAPYDIEFRVIHPGGIVHWLSTTATVFRNENGEPVRMLGATSDVTARKLAETHLRQQWLTFDTALSHSPDFTYTFDLAGRFTYSNRALLSLLQLRLEEIIGKNFFDLGYPADLAQRLQFQIRQVIETREPVRDMTPFTGPGGQTRHYEYIFVPVFAAEGLVAAVAGSTRDITERNRTEEALRISEERLTLALEAGGGVGAWDWDIAADRVYANPQFAALYSIDPEQAASGVPVASFVDRVHADDRPRVDRSLQNALRTGGVFAEEYRVIQQDGLARWVYARGRCHLDAAGRPSRFPGVVFDITERKRADQALRESQDRLRAIFDGTYEYIGLLSPEGTLLEANRASLEFAENTREDVIGRVFWDTPWFIATAGAPEAVREGVSRAAAGEFIRFEATLRRPSGETPTFDISFHPVRNESGEVILIVPEGRDITGLKKTEEALRRSNEELQRANRELEEFAYVASHDLQEPLRMVNIYTQMILKDLGVTDGKLNQYAVFVRQGVQRMETLIHDLLTFSRTVHSDELPVGTTDLSVALSEAISVLKDRIEETGSTIAAGPLPVVQGDKEQMIHVFQNLLSNALKYRRRGVPPRISIAAERAGSHWNVCVADNGIGFEPQYAERIFGLFKRLHKEEYPGTGLGLAICQRIIERFGGHMWAEGRPGDGATFYFSLPEAQGS